jgi:hypothetical protein
MLLYFYNIFKKKQTENDEWGYFIDLENTSFNCSNNEELIRIKYKVPYYNNIDEYNDDEEEENEHNLKKNDNSFYVLIIVGFLYINIQNMIYNIINIICYWYQY